MPLSIGLSARWQGLRQAHVGVEATWRKLRNTHIGVDGVWKPLWSYDWITGDWSQCSADCGGGTQTRTVACQRSDGQTVEDVFCDAASRPAASQECNTQGCEECKYAYSNNGAVASCVINWMMFGESEATFFWDNTHVGAAAYNTTEIYVDGYRYYRGSLQDSDSGSGFTFDYYQICRTPA